MTEPGRMIETTLSYGNRSASFVFIDKTHLPNESLRTLLRSLNVDYARGSDPTPSSQTIDVMELAQYIIEAGYNPDLYQNERFSRQFQPSPSIINLVEASSIVIANSPPAAIDFATLAKNASAVTMGAFIGYQVGANNPPLLFLTVPAGMIICGASWAVSQALERGLKELILSKLFGISAEQTILARKSNKNSKSKKGQERGTAG
jgi:hypothetical protein